jgi:hypothetical protein
MKFLKIYLISSVVIVFFCTENPLFKDKEIKGNAIKGKVSLEGRQSAENVFIWLEGYNLGTFTDQNGAFQLALSTSSQSSGGMTGQFRLYFYVNNYQLDSASVVLVNGNIQAAAGDLDKNGTLKQTVLLTKTLDIDVAVTPTVISANFSDSLHLTVTLQAYPDSVLITSKIRDALYLGAVFIKSSGNNQNIRLIDQGGSLYTKLPIYREYKVPNYKRQYFMTIPFNAKEYSAGEVEIIPYLMVTPIKLPAGLLRNFTRNYQELSTDFLNIPIVRNGGTIRIGE